VPLNSQIAATRDRGSVGHCEPSVREFGRA